MGTLLRVRTAILATAVAAALLGALVAPARVTLLGGPVVGATSVAVVVLVAWGTCSPRPSPRSLCLIGTVGTLGVPFLFALPLLGSAGAVLVVLLLLLGSVRPAEHPRTSRGSAVPR